MMTMIIIYFHNMKELILCQDEGKLLQDKQKFFSSRPSSSLPNYLVN